MALVPCRVCGALNSTEADTCLSCGHDPNGYRRPIIFRIVALLLAVALVVSLMLGVILWFSDRRQPKPNGLPSLGESATLINPMSGSMKS